MKRTYCRLSTSAWIALFVTLLLSNVGTAVADIPSILKIESFTQGSPPHRVIVLEIAHSNPSQGHYVDMVEVEVAGMTQGFYLQPQAPLPPSTRVFPIRFDIDLSAFGEIQMTVEVKARGHCTQHGWGAWSQTITVLAVSSTKSSSSVTSTFSSRASTVSSETSTFEVNPGEGLFLQTYGLYIAGGVVTLLIVAVAVLLVTRRKGKLVAAPVPITIPEPAAPAASTLAPPPVSPSSNKFCINCGSTIPLTYTFCNKCGSKQP